MTVSSWLAAAGCGALLLAGCSNGSGGSNAGGTTVAVRSTSSGRVLVTSAGRTLYQSDQEKAAGRVLCASSACEAIWTPLTVPVGQQPSAPSGVKDALSVVTRPDGKRQVEYRGAPLYTFSFDHTAGDINGNGTKDSFDGTDFTWHAATAAGSVSGGNGSNPGYGY